MSACPGVVAEQQLLSELRGRHGGKRMSLADLLEAELEADEQALDKKHGLSQPKLHQERLTLLPGEA